MSKAKMFILQFACLCVLAVASIAEAEWSPTGYASWRDGGERKEVVGALFNYRDADGSFHPFEQTWESVDDTLFVSERDVVTCRVRANGDSRVYVEIGDDTVRVDRRLVRFDWLDTVTFSHVTIHEPDFDDADVGVQDERDVVFDFPWWDYRVRRAPAQVAHQIVMQKSLLDSLSKLYAAMTPTWKNRCALANVYKIRVSVDDSVLLNVPRCRKKVFKRLVRFAFGNRVQRLHFPGSESFNVPVYQEFWKVDGQMYMGEYVRMKTVDSIHRAHPDWELWHAASETLNDLSVEDTYIKGNTGYTCYNYGDAANLLVVNGSGSSDCLTFVRCWDVSDVSLPAGTEFSACSLRTCVNAVVTTASVSAYRVFKAWAEGDDWGGYCSDSGATWNGADSYWYSSSCNTRGCGYWETVGCGCGDADGVDNCSVLGDCVDEPGVADRSSSALSTVSVSTTGFKKWAIDVTLAQGWYDGTADENGVVLRTTTTNGNVTFNATEVDCTPNGSCEADVQFEFYWTEAGGSVIIIDGDE